jgi:hypothetical protein
MWKILVAGFVPFLKVEGKMVKRFISNATEVAAQTIQQ